MIKLKQKILASPFGAIALEVSLWRSLISAINKNPEAACSSANRVIADRLIGELCRPNGTFADVGAHIGSILKRVHAKDSTIRILAFEADTIKARWLKAAFPYCEVFDVAVGESIGQVDFFINEKYTGYNTIVDSQSDGARKITVRLAPLDSLIGDHDLDLMKVDVEGAELGVFIGGENTIERYSPTIMFESVGEGENSLGYSAYLIWEWFRDHGYEIFTPDRVAHDARALCKEAFLDCHQYPFRTHNYFAIHRQRRTEIRDRARYILGV